MQSLGSERERPLRGCFKQASHVNERDQVIVQLCDRDDKLVCQRTDRRSVFDLVAVHHHHFGNSVNDEANVIVVAVLDHQNPRLVRAFARLLGDIPSRARTRPPSLLT